MPAETPDLGLDEQDQAEVFDETNLDDDAEFVTLEEMPDVYDATSALGDSRDLEALDADELDPATLDDEDVDGEDGVDQLELDEVELDDVADIDEATDPDDENEADYESEDLSDGDLEDLGYRDQPTSKHRSTGAKPEDVPDEVHPHQEELLDEGVEETLPASDPVSVKRIT